MKQVQQTCDDDEDDEDDDNDDADIYIMVECMYLSCHEKVTPSWIADDDDIYMPKLPTLPSHCTLAHCFSKRARADDDHYKF